MLLMNEYAFAGKISETIRSPGTPAILFDEGQPAIDQESCADQIRMPGLLRFLTDKCDCLTVH